MVEELTFKVCDIHHLRSELLISFNQFRISDFKIKQFFSISTEIHKICSECKKPNQFYKQVSMCLVNNQILYT